MISPNEIKKQFYDDLNKVLSYGNVKFFQLRLKNIKKDNLINIAKKIRKITFKHKVKLIINDNFNLVSKIKADGCHMGQLDGSIKIAKKKLKNKILGITCHDSIELAKEAVKQKVNYVAFGSFFKSKLKPGAKKADPKIMIEVKKKKKRPNYFFAELNNLKKKK